jgi:hypothetical protein
MADLNTEIVAYLTVSNIRYTSSDYQTGQPEGQPNQILSWNTSALGAKPTQEQLDASYIVWQGQQVQEQNKTAASALLSATDWTAIPSVADPAQSNPYLTNQTEFIAWRNQIRAIAITPPTTPATFPAQPTEQWGS